MAACTKCLETLYALKRLSGHTCTGKLGAELPPVSVSRLNVRARTLKVSAIAGLIAWSVGGVVFGVLLARILGKKEETLNFVAVGGLVGYMVAFPLYWFKMCLVDVMCCLANIERNTLELHRESLKESQECRAHDA